MKLKTIGAVTLTFAFFSSVHASEWQIDSARSVVHFAVHSHLIPDANGTFGKVSGTIHYDSADVSHDSVTASIAMDPINTGNPKRDHHLGTHDFFDVSKFPTATFQSTKVEGEKQKLKVTGNLTVHGITKSVVLDVEGLADPATTGTAHATTKLSRRDFGVGGAMGGDQVVVSIDIVLTPNP
jgi:polyisoprenoid-binding protein YceI